MNPLKEKIVISGIGVVSPLGIGKKSVWQNLDQGRSVIKPVTIFDTSNLNSKLGGQISDFKPEEILGSQGLRNYDRTTCLAISAAKLALEDANFVLTENNATEIGVVLGSALGSLHSISEMDKQALREGPRSLDPGLCPNVVLCGPASQISIRLGIRGFTATVSNGFNSSFSALQYGMQMLDAGTVKSVLVGAVEELCESTFKGFYRLGALSGSLKDGQELNAPFDCRRNGFVLGEGAVVFLLQKMSDAIAVRNHIYAIISEFHEQFVHSSSQNSIRESFKKWGDIFDAVEFDRNKIFSDIDFVSLGANSSVLGDALEAKIFMSLFAKKRSMPAASTIKSMMGESYSASGCFQLLGALYAMDTSRLFPTTGFENEDPRCPAPFLSKSSISRRINKALVWSLGYGRSNYYMVCKKTEENAL